MIIAFINQKGGVGKTTSTINIGACIAEQGYKVLLVDFDPQANLSSGIGEQNKQPTIYNVLSLSVDIQESIVSTYQKNLYIIPADNALSGTEVELANLDEREFFLKNVLIDIQDDFDFIFLDCPPSLGLLTVNAFCAADSIIIPLQCEYYAMEGIAQLIHNIKRIQKSINPMLAIFGIVLTMYDSRTKLSQEVASEIVNAFGSNVFQTIIPRNIKIAEAPSFGQSVLAYDAECVGTKSYKKLSMEIITKWKEIKNQ